MVTFYNDCLSSAKRVQNSNKSIAVFKKHTGSHYRDFYYECIFSKYLQYRNANQYLLYIKLEYFEANAIGELVEFETGAPLSNSKQYVVSPCYALLKALKEEGIDVNSLTQVEIDAESMCPKQLATIFASCQALQIISNKDAADSVLNAQGKLDLRSCRLVFIAQVIWHITHPHVLPSEDLPITADFMIFSTKILEDFWRGVLDMLQSAKESLLEYDLPTRELVETSYDFGGRWGYKLRCLVKAYIGCLDHIDETGSCNDLKAPLFEARYKPDCSF